MSNSVSALRGAVAPGEVTVREDGLQGMITLRGDLSNAKLKSVCKAVTGAMFPKMGHADTADAIAKIDKALKGQHYLAENLSDARALIFVEGTYSREVMAKAAPVDLHPSTFQPGDFRRTRLGQVAAAFWMKDDDTFAIICFRSVADYTFKLLAAAAKGGAVGHF